MNKIFLFFFIITSSCLFAVNEKDYLYYINLLVEKNYNILSQQEKLNNAKWTKLKQLGLLLPQVSLNHQRNYKINNDINEINWSSDLSVKQILFSGFSAINSLFASGYLESFEEFSLYYKKLLAYEEAAKIYFNYAFLFNQKESLKEAVLLMQKRVDELKRREKIGKARSSEVYSSIAKLSQIKSQLLEIELTFDNASLDIESQIGEKIETFIYPLKSNLNKISLDVNENIISNHPYIKMMEEQLKYYETLSSIKKGSFLPQIYLIANYNLGGSNYVSSSPSFRLMASWDIFTGGSRFFETLSSEALLLKAKYELEEIKRIVKTQIQKYVNNYNYSILILNELYYYYDNNLKNLKELENDYKTGNATNLEVLQAMMDLKDAKIAYEKAKINSVLNEFLLQNILGNFIYNLEKK